jgi:hypothetical protein
VSNCKDYCCRYDPSTQQKFRHLTSLTLALGSMWLPWVTRGVYVGKRRILFTNQVRCNGDFSRFSMDVGTCPLPLLVQVLRPQEPIIGGRNLALHARS